jgi:hypothetical protein
MCGVGEVEELDASARLDALRGLFQRSAPAALREAAATAGDYCFGPGVAVQGMVDQVAVHRVAPWIEQGLFPVHRDLDLGPAGEEWVEVDDDRRVVVATSNVGDTAFTWTILFVGGGRSDTLTLLWRAFTERGAERGER